VYNTSMKHFGIILVSVLTVGAVGAIIIYSMDSKSDRHPWSPASLKKTIKILEPLHKKLPPPKPGDWLYTRKEPGQTFSQYLFSRPVTPSKNRKIIYILPIGDFSGKQQKILDLTCRFMSAYFNLETRQLKAIDDSAIPEKARRRHPEWGMKQFLSTYILDKVLLPRLPKDGMVLFGITATDLWPGKGWNFVYGQASLRQRVGVQSIYRNGELDKGREETTMYLRRTLKTATHEMGHVISILHCTAWECNMCGSNHRDESDRHPLWMCPECNAKLCWAVKIDPKKRYLNLYRICMEYDLKKAADLYRKSFLKLGGSEEDLKKTEQKPATRRPSRS